VCIVNQLLFFEKYYVNIQVQNYIHTRKGVFATAVGGNRKAHKTECHFQ
jgi:hypothetical protein